MTIYDRALEFVKDGDTVGLGTGRAASAFVRALAASGKRVRGVPTSDATAELARSLGIEVVGLDAGLPLALTVDGADEVDPAHFHRLNSGCRCHPKRHLSASVELLYRCCPICAGNRQFHSASARLCNHHQPCSLHLHRSSNWVGKRMDWIIVLEAVYCSYLLHQPLYGMRLGHHPDPESKGNHRR